MLLRHSTLVSLVLSSFGLIATAATGCASASSDGTTGDVVGEDTIQPFEDPERLLGTVSRKLTDNITEADIGKTFGTPDELVPYPDTYWPMTEDGINARWNGTEASPLEKFVSMADPSNLAAAQAWNSKNSGKEYPGVQDWFGICHGWTAAAISEAPIKHAVYAKISGGNAVACQPSEVGQGGCTKFDIGDMNALMATIYADGGSKFIGARCDTSPNAMKRDADGRVERTGNGAGCKGLNPGSLMIVLAHRMKRDQKALAIDAQTDFNTDQIWNQPAYRYTVNDYKKIDGATAARLVSTTNAAASYKWNTSSNGFAFVDLTVHWVSEHGPNTTFFSGLSSTHTTRMTAVIELDRPATDPEARIIGGELTEDASASTSRLENHPFVWLSNGPGNDTGNSGHNPFVKTSIVRQLMALGRDASATPASASTTPTTPGRHGSL